MKKAALIGANGMLAAAVRKLAPSEYSLQCYDLPDFDLTDRAQVFSLVETEPDIIINCAAFTNVDGCESQSDLALQVNGEGPGLLADLAKMIGSVLVHVSTDFVFDGNKATPYVEEDQPHPLSVYGQSKLLGEQRIIESGLKAFFIIRTSWLYGAGGNNFVETILRLAGEKERLTIIADQCGTPTWAEDLAGAIWELLKQASHLSAVATPYGIYHYSNSGECSWHEFACAIVDEARRAGLSIKAEEIAAIPTEAYPLPATRPKYSVLSKEKITVVTGIEIPNWQESLHQYFQQQQKGENGGN